jgi:multidrug resistance efflux pump
MMAAIFIAYAALIWLVFDKLRLIKLSLPLALVLAAVGPLFAFFILVSMNNFHPSSSDARVFQRVVQIVPHISSPGRVQDIATQPNTPVKKGDVLFNIDPKPFQIEVNRLQAALAAAQQAVPQLKSSLDQAAAATEKATAQLNLARSDFERQQELFEKKVVAEAALDRFERNFQSAEQAVIGAKAAEERARQAYESNIGDENTTVAQVQQQLAQATYNLEESVVRAPCSGYVTNLQLETGAIVSAAASVMPFVCDRDERNQGVVVASFMQAGFIHISPGDYAEVVFPMYPGEVFAGKVITAIDATSEGQLTATGLLPGTSTSGEARFPVRIHLDKSDDLRLPAGTQGIAAVYTGNVQVAGIIRMALMRLTSWTNYLFFTS